MIVPYKDEFGKRPKPGDKVVLTKNVSQHYFFVTAGHVLTYMGTDKRYNPGDILMDDETKIKLKHISCLDYTMYCSSYNEARQYYIDNVEKDKFLTYIKQNCEGNSGKYPNCPFKDGNCIPLVSCIEHIPSKVYKENEFIKNYIRKIKIWKIVKI